MSIRVTQRAMYQTMASQMQRSLAAYMESNEQGSTQKKINRPSDDPAAMYRILMTQDNINAIKQYSSNADTAEGWLKLADNILGTQVPTALTRLKSLAEQASTGSYSAENRKQIAFEARQIFGELLNLSNTEFEDKTIFSGHRYDQSAFKEGLALSCADEDWNAIIQEGCYSIDPKCASDTSIMVQFVESGSIDDATFPAYRWSSDGGDTWATGRSTVSSDTVEMDLGNGVVISLDKAKIGDTLAKRHPEETNPTLGISKAATEMGPGENNGTLLYIRPTAIYGGDDDAPLPEISAMGKITRNDCSVTSGTIAGGVTAQGTFDNDMLVQISEKNGDEFTYRYKSVAETKWTTGTATASGNQSLELKLSSGSVKIADTSSVSKGTQILVHSHIVTGAVPGTDTSSNEKTEGTIVSELFGGTFTIDGEFPTNLMLRFENNIDISNKEVKINYSYKTSNDEDWHEHNPLTITVSGNALNFSTQGKNITIPLDDIKLQNVQNLTTIPAGTEIVIHNNSATPTAAARGVFGGNVLVKLEGAADLSSEGNTVTYSYSTDGGGVWTEAKALTTGEGTLRLPVSGGYVSIENTSSAADGTQLLVHPERDELKLEILQGSYITLNNVGKDIFGGYYEGKPVSNSNAEDIAAANLFEMVGDFIAYCENNNQDGCQRTLARLTTVEGHILTETARIGGLENRVSTAKDVLSFQKTDQEERLSYLEDIDLTELLTKLTRQQLTYQTVLQSSSKIMQMSLANYL